MYVRHIIPKLSTVNIMYYIICIPNPDVVFYSTGAVVSADCNMFAYIYSSLVTEYLGLLYVLHCAHTSTHNKDNSVTIIVLYFQNVIIIYYCLPEINKLNVTLANILFIILLTYTYLFININTYNK